MKLSAVMCGLPAAVLVVLTPSTQPTVVLQAKVVVQLWNTPVVVIPRTALAMVIQTPVVVELAMLTEPLEAVAEVGSVEVLHAPSPPSTPPITS